jgi:hypothetical protein
MLSIDSDTRHIKLPERKNVLMVHDSINKKYGSCLQYSKHSAFILLYFWSTIVILGRVSWLNGTRRSNFIIFLILFVLFYMYLIWLPAQAFNKASVSRANWSHRYATCIFSFKVAGFFDRRNLLVEPQSKITRRMANWGIYPSLLISSISVNSNL